MHKIQEKLLEIAENPPKSKITLRLLGELVGEPNHPQKIKHHLDQLIKVGALKIFKKDGTIVKIERTKIGLNKSSMYTIPVLGAANCGIATNFADNHVEGYLKISQTLVESKSKQLFAVRAVGSSMNKAMVGAKKLVIEDGDYIVADAGAIHPANGDYVVSTIDDVANIKRFILDKDNNQIILVSESTKEYPPIYIDARDPSVYVVNGKVVQVIKKPSY